MDDSELPPSSATSQKSRRFTRDRSLPHMTKNRRNVVKRTRCIPSSASLSLSIRLSSAFPFCRYALMAANLLFHSTERADVDARCLFVRTRRQKAHLSTPINGLVIRSPAVTPVGSFSTKKSPHPSPMSERVFSTTKKSVTPFPVKRLPSAFL
jgi:hypothetical protein